MSTLPRPVFVAAGSTVAETTLRDTEGCGTIGSPFGTVARAIAFLRDRGWSATQAADQVVNVGPGKYYHPNGVALAAQDSGGNGHKVVFRSTDGAGAAELVGGELASAAGWTLHSGSIYKRKVSANVWSLYENGVRAIAARLPVLNPGPDFPCAKSPYFETTGVGNSYTLLQYDPLDFTPDTWSLTTMRLYVWSGGDYFGNGIPINWFSDTAAPTALNTVDKRFSLDHGGTKFPLYRFFVDGARFFVQGVLELLQGPGQFVCKADAAGQIWLYYWARDGAAPAQEIVIPSTKRVLSLVGTSATDRISNIEIDGLAVSCSAFGDWYRYGDNGNDPDNPYGYFYTPALFQQGGFYIENADHLTIGNVHAKNVGFAGIFLQDYVQSCTFSNVWCEHTGTDGISANGRGPGLGDVLKLNGFFNIKVNNYGELDGSSQALRLSQASHHTISNFDFSQGPRRAIWIQGAFDVPASQNYAHSNLITLGRITDVCQDSGDVGGITMSFLAQPPLGTGPINTPNRVDQVIIDGVEADPSMRDRAPNGCFLDNHSSWQRLSNVWALNTQGALFRMNDADNPQLSNCSFLANGLTNPSFNPGGMSPAIGLDLELWPFTP